MPLVRNLTWSGNDGFDPRGRRVAAVAHCVDLMPFPAVQGGGHGPGFIAPRQYWEAYLAHEGRFDHVLVDGRPGRWATQDEAKAATELAYEASVPESAGDGVDAPPGDAAPDRAQEPRGVRAQIRSIVRAWRTVYRDNAT